MGSGVEGDKATELEIRLGMNIRRELERIPRRYRVLATRIPPSILRRA
jgi:hypothetical protein